ncbi:MAG: HTH domain-containing protein [Myxococcales bacterium]|jgi:ribonuclease E
MTFYEAALSVLAREGKPLHVSAITELALKENLLSHVGKSPEEVMQSRLLAMARRRTDRRVIATAPQTFALADWGLPEDQSAYEPVVEESREKLEGPPLRGRERHPVASPAKVRIAGRGERMRGWREEDEERRRWRKLPPLCEVAVEVLTAAGTPLTPVDLAAAARERELVSEDLGAEALLNALREDNRRRSESGRRPLFDLLPSGEVALRPAPAEAAELEAAVAYAMGMPLRREEAGPGAAKLVALAAEHRRQVVRQMRRRLGELDASALEKAVEVLLAQQGFVDVKVARRSREGPLLVARRREGLTELRYALRLMRGNLEVGRDEVSELRRSVGQHGAHMGILVSAADPTREARQEAAASQPLVVLLCGDSLAETFMEKRVGCSVTAVEVFDLDEEFFRRSRERGREERESRREARERREGHAGREPRGEQRERRPWGNGARPHGSAVEQAREPAAAVSDEQRQQDAAALAEAMVAVPDSEALRRREDEARLRAAAHERIEAAELQSRAKRAPSGTAA